MPIYLSSAWRCVLVPALALSLIAPSWSQGAAEDDGALATQAGGDAAASSGKTAIMEPKVNEGELRVDGTVTMITTADAFTLNVMSFTTSKGKTVELTEAKPKTVTTSGATTFYARGEAANKLAFSDIKIGMRLTVVGKDAGSGKEMPAREVVLWIERERETKSLGTVRVEHEVGKLIDRGDAARQVRDLHGALRFFNRAVEHAIGVGDRSGQALALSRAASIHGDMEQLDQAMSLYNRALALWRTVGNTSSEATTLNNIAIIYGKQGQNDQAIEAFERATVLLHNGGNKKAIVLTWGNLASAYMDAERYDKARQTLEQVLPMVRGGADKGAEAEILSQLAHLAVHADQMQVAQAYVDQARPLLDAIGDKETKARTLYNLALTFHSAGDTQHSMDYYQQTLTLARAAEDKSLEQAAMRGMAALQTAGQK